MSAAIHSMRPGYARLGWCRACWDALNIRRGHRRAGLLWASPGERDVVAVGVATIIGSASDRSLRRGLAEQVRDLLHPIRLRVFQKSGREGRAPTGVEHDLIRGGQAKTLGGPDEFATIFSAGAEPAINAGHLPVASDARRLSLVRGGGGVLSWCHR
jgi:hypothetical protein